MLPNTLRRRDYKGKIYVKNISKKLSRIRNQVKSWIRNRKNHSGFATLVVGQNRFVPDLTFHCDADAYCAAKAFYSCPAIISRRPGSQNTPKESQLNPEENSRIKQARSHVTLEKSSKNYKPFEE
jgi:hypothetical protein